MSRPSPQSEPTDHARTLRQASARMLEEAAQAGLLAPLHTLIATAIAALFDRLLALLAAWRAGTLPPLPEPRPVIARPTRQQAQPAIRPRRRAHTPRQSTPTPRLRLEIGRWLPAFPSPPRTHSRATVEFRALPTRHKRRR